MDEQHKTQLAVDCVVYPRQSLLNGQSGALVLSAVERSQRPASRNGGGRIAL